LPVPDFGRRMLSPLERLTVLEEHVGPVIETVNDLRERQDAIEGSLRRWTERACYALAAMVFGLWSSGNLTPEQALQIVEWCVRHLLLP
jgi:hypothetical protein